MNNNTFSTNSTIINEHYMLFPYNEHHNYSSQSVNDILIHSSSNTSNNHDDLDYHHQFLQPSPFFSQFESLPDLPLFASFLPQNNAHGPNDIHHQSPRLPSFIGDQPLEPLDHFQDSQKISASLDPKMKKIKKPSRTDRHSKIKTAKGTRDRRMRLSVDVARELFGLQDMLGFDKASKTVEWLLTQAKPEIIKIAKSLSHHCGFCSGDESQTRPTLGSMNTTSDIGEFASMWTADDRSSNIDMAETRGNKVDARSMKGKTKRLQKRTPILTKLSKDARAKARERAKYRTKEKMMKRISQVKIVQEEANDHDHDDIIMNRKTDVNWSSFETTLCEKDQIEERCNYYRFADCSEFVMNKKHHIPDESYDTINNLNSSFPMLNHHRNPEAATSIEQQHQHRFADLHNFLGRPRSLIYNYENMC